MSALTDKLKKQAKALIPRFYREYKGASDWWHSVKVDGAYYDLNFLTHDPDGTGEFPSGMQSQVKVVAYKHTSDPYPKGTSLGYFKGKKVRRKFEDMEVEENPAGIHPRIQETFEEYGVTSPKTQKRMMSVILRALPVSQRTLDGMEYAVEKYFKKMGQKAYGQTMKSMGYVRANPSGGRVSMRLGSLWGKGYSKPSRPLFSKGGYAVVTTYTDGQIDIGTPHSTKAEAEEAALYAQQMASAESGRRAYKIEVLPVTSVAKNPPAKGGGYIVVKTYTGGRQEFTDHIETLAEARKFRKYFLDQNEKSLLYRGRTLFDSVEIFPHTAILRNPPLSSHGSSIKIKRTHGLSLAEMKALYKLVKQGSHMATAFARKKLEVPRSASASDLLAVVDHHIRDLAGR